MLLMETSKMPSVPGNCLNEKMKQYDYVCFVHFQKTGGISISKSIAEKYKLKGSNFLKEKNFYIVGKHYPLWYLKKAYADKKVLFFTVLREPESWYESFINYFYQKRGFRYIKKGVPSQRWNMQFILKEKFNIKDEYHPSEFASESEVFKRITHIDEFFKENEDEYNEFLASLTPVEDYFYMDVNQFEKTIYEHYLNTFVNGIDVIVPFEQISEVFTAFGVEEKKLNTFENIQTKEKYYLYEEEKKELEYDKELYNKIREDYKGSCI